MRASTLVGLAIALFLGAVAVVAVRYSGLLDKTQEILEKKETRMVLVAKRNIFEGITVVTADVMTRPATSAELRFIELNEKNIMPANVEAAALRIASRHISVDELLLRDSFLEQSIPDSPTKRLEPGMRSVNVVIPRDRAASGLLRAGEFVDVLLTTTICTDAKCTNPRTATAPLAQHLKIIVKRDNLWTVMESVKEDQPVSYILQANPYRAALIELAKTKGTLALSPTSNNIKAPAANSARDDSVRVAAFVNGDSSVTDLDLERIFNLQPVQSPEPPLAVEHYKGVDYVGTTVMDKTNGRNAQLASSKNGSTGYGFFVPAQNLYGPKTADCPTCGKK